MYPSNLPAPQKLKLTMQSLAVLDAIFSPEWMFRYYSFNSAWGSHEQMGSIRNGSGDDVFVLFNDSGCFLKGFSHEFPQNALTPNMFYEKVPAVFSSGVNEPAFTPDNVSYCAWHELSDNGWKSSVKEQSLDSNIFFLIEGLDGNASTYQKFVEDYYEMECGIENLQDVFKQLPMTRELAVSMNPEVEYASLISDLDEIGYPYEDEVVDKPKGFLGKLFRRN